MQFIREKFRLIFPLAVMAYLGFYFYGLIMGVFGVVQLATFSIAAVVLSGLLIAQVIVGRRHADEMESPTSAHARAFRTQRERRGF